MQSQRSLSNQHLKHSTSVIKSSISKQVNIVELETLNHSLLLMNYNLIFTYKILFIRKRNQIFMTFSIIMTSYFYSTNYF